MNTEQIAALAVKIHLLRKQQVEAKKAHSDACASAHEFNLQDGDPRYAFQCAHRDEYHHPAFHHADIHGEGHGSIFENCYLVWHRFRDNLPADWLTYNEPFEPCPHCQPRIETRRTLLAITRQLGSTRASLTRLLNREVQA